MKKLLIWVFSLIVIFASAAYSKDTKYSYDSIIIYNSGVALQKQGKYELAEKKYYQALKLQPNFIEARHNLSIIYHEYAMGCGSIENPQKAIEYAKKSIEFDSKSNAYSFLAQCYREIGDYPSAIDVYKKVLASNPKDDIAMAALAQVYMKTQDYDKAAELYRNILSLYPDDKNAQQNLKYVNYKRTDSILNKSLNNISNTDHAPQPVYRLIKPSYGITKKTVEQMKSILDIIWSDPTGKIYLQAMVQNKVAIKINQGAITANAMRQTGTRTFYLYGFIPIFSYDINKNSVNVAYNYIHNFYDPKLDSDQRIYSLQVFFHEFGHAYLNIKYPGHPNSIEEELGVTMIGYNSAYKIITGQYLTKEQTEFYAMGSLEALLKDEHRNLPVYGAFSWQTQKSGINLPYPEVYKDLPQMYKKLLSEGKITPVPNFYVYRR